MTMATTFGPERVMGAAPMNSLQGPPSGRHVPAVLSMDAANRTTHFDTTSNAPQPPRTMPPPNPPFVFPARPIHPPGPASSKSTGRRPRSVVDIPDLSAAATEADINESGSSSSSSNVPAPSAGRPALPNFTFNPGASLSPDSTAAFLSPPLSPRSSRHGPSPSMSGTHGHRRGGSEFVGGNIRTGESITIMNTSPTKAESGVTSPTLQPPSAGGPSPSPGGRRRGHNHRRSAALSSHDLTLILQPPQPPGSFRGSSAPASPAGFGQKFEDPRTSSSEQFSVPKTPEPEKATTGNREPTPKEGKDSTDAQSTPRARPALRARVGFSDEVEVIPRPLSLVSSDGSSTATARPGGHSVSGSLSSIISELDMTIPESQTEESAPLERTSTRQAVDSRPSTAGAVLERSESIQSVSRSGPSLHRRNSIPALSTLPDPSATVTPASPSPTKTPKRWSFFGLDPFAGSPSTTGGPASSRAASYDMTRKLADWASVPSDRASDTAVEPGYKPGDNKGASAQQAPGKAANKKKKKNKRKVKSWAGSILKSKSKPRSKRSPSPSMAHADVDEETAGQKGPASSHQDEPASGSPSEEMSSSVAAPVVTVTDSSEAPEEERRRGPRPMAFDDDSSYPMIDLDAALGPFNTPLPHNPEWEAAQKAAGPVKRQLHSALGMRGFSGPGMHYHRRAESAPEMVPFEAARFGINRFGSSSTMADVFEEDEEDEEDKTTSSRPTDGGSSKDSTTAATETGSEDETPPATTAAKTFNLDGPTVQDTSTAEKRRRHAASMKSERSTTSLHEQVIVEEAPSGVPPVPTPAPFQTQNRSDSTSSAAPSPGRVLAGNNQAAGSAADVSPLQLPTCNPVPVSPYSMSQASSFPSPRTPVSYDAQRISTAPSSVNDETTLQSLLLGEPGPEVRLSMDVPPSLTSSASTMTRDGSWIPGPQPRAQLPFQPDQRPLSVSSMAFGRRRSSLASLSRLINSSHGERSKLSTEVQYESETEKKQKISKAKRLSRLMQFWKPKAESKESTKP